MSFYGSVYYQLIDTFYKIIVKNSGNKTYNFNTTLINPEGTPSTDLVESPAIGRKGIFSLDSGNYWINFSKTTDTDEAAPYKIWHSPANINPTEVLPVGGLAIETDKYIITKDTSGNEVSIVDSEGNELIAGENYIQLQDHEFIRTYNTQYDEAGHIIDDKTESILYRLPKANVNERVDRMETILGQPSEGLEFPRPDIPAMEIDDLPEGEEYEGEMILSVTDYAEKNFEDIKRLERFVGNWEQSHNYYYDHNPSITEWIGDLDLLYGESGEYGTQNKEDTLVRIIGDLPEMRKLYENTISISDVFSAAKESSDTQFKSVNDNITALQDGLINLNFVVGSAEGRNKSVFTEIDEIYDTIGKPANEDRQPIYTEIDNINSDIDGINKTIGAQGSYNDIYTEIEQLHTTIGTQGSKDNVYAELDNINTILGEQGAKSAVYTELGKVDSALSAINTTIGTQGEKGSVYHEIELTNSAVSDNKSLIETHISTANEAFTSINSEIGNLGKAHTELSNSVWKAIGPNDSTSTESINARIESINTNIDKIVEFVGEDEDATETLAQQIQNISDDIGSEATEGTILHRISNSEKLIGNNTSFSGTVIEHISNIESLVGQKDSSTKTIIERLGAAELITAQVGPIGVAAEANGAAIQTMNAAITSLQETTKGINETSIPDLEQSISDLETQKIDPLDETVQEITNTTIPGIQNSIQNLCNETIDPLSATVTDINTKIPGLTQSVELLTTSIGDVTTLEGQTILNKLLELSEQIEGIKVKINELHTGDGNPPFPEVIPSIPESE